MYIDSSFTPSEQDAIKESILNLNYVLNYQIQFIIVDDGFNMSTSQIQYAQANHGVIVLKIEDTSSLLKSGDTRTLAFVDKLNGSLLYLIIDRIHIEDLSNIITHEFLHTLGVMHKEQTIMSPMYYRKYYNCVQESIAESIAIKNNLDVSIMHYCNDINE